MASKDYCENVSMELSGWKARISEIVEKLDRLSTGAKEKVVPEVYALHMMIEELNDRIEGLHRACDLNWAPRNFRGVDSWQRPDVLGLARTIPQSDIGG